MADEPKVNTLKKAEKEEAKAKGSKKWTAPPEKRIKVRVFNRELKEGIGWAFNFRRTSIVRPDGGRQRFPIETYHLKNGGTYNLPEAVIEHLEMLAYPTREYKEGMDEGQSLPITGSYKRIVISRV